MIIIWEYKFGVATIEKRMKLQLLHVQGQEGQLVQGKEQQLCFAGAAVKRYHMFNVKETQVRL